MLASRGTFVSLMDINIRHLNDEKSEEFIFTAEYEGFLFFG